MKNDQKKNKNSFILMFLMVLLLINVGYLLFKIYEYLFNNLDFQLTEMLIIFIPLFILTYLISKVAKQNQVDDNKQYQSDSDELSIDDHEQIQTNKINTQKNNYQRKNIIPVTILVVVFMAFMINRLNLFSSSDPTGKWIYEMEEYATIDGVTNLTDYWYMIFYEDGSLDIGIKNVNYPEDSEGSGSWYLSEGIIYVTINYDYGYTDQLSLIIKGNELVDAVTNIGTNYIKE